jgi:hypothetical protein
MPDLMKHRPKNGERLTVFSVGRMFHHNLVRYMGMQGGWNGFWIGGELDASGLKSVREQYGALW